MPIRTFRPDATVFADAWANVGGAASLHAATSDDSDDTYAQHDGVTPPASALIFDVAGTALGAGERVAFARVRARINNPGSPVRFRYDVGPDAGGPWTTVSSDQGGIDATWTGGWSSDLLDVDDQQLDVLDLLRWKFELVKDPDPALTVKEAYVDLDVWEAVDDPTVDVPAATGTPATVTDTDRPTIEAHTTSLNDGTPNRWTQQVRVFRDAVYGAGSFDPATETDVEWETATDGMPSVDPGEPDTFRTDQLGNNDTYRAYVRYGKDGVAGETLWSGWTFFEFDLTLTLPAAPTVTQAVHQAAGRQLVDVTTAALTHATVERLEVQRTDDGGTTWATIRGGVLTDGLAASTLYTFHDYDVPRDVAVQYRARTTEATAGGQETSSDWAMSATEAHPLDGNWWLYDVGEWMRVFGGARVVELPEVSIESDVGVFHPLGRDGQAVVVGGTQHGDDGAYDLLSTGTVEVAAVDDLARWGGTVLVKDPFGSQKYIRWTSRRMQLAGTPSEPRHRWGLEYVEVDSGIGEDG